MKRLQTHQTDITKEVLALILKVCPMGKAVSTQEWNTAYQIVYAKQLADTIQWKLNHMEIA